MNRRNFLKRLGIGAVSVAVVAALPKILNPSVPPTTYRTYIVGDQALTLADLRKCKESLVKMEVKPSNGGFVGYIHPDVVADIFEQPFVYKWKFQMVPSTSRLRFVDAA